MTTPTVRFTSGSLLRASLIVVAWVIGLVVAHRARADLVWFLEAAVVAGLAHPAVTRLGRTVPAWLAVLGVSTAALALAALFGYVVFAEMRAEAEAFRARAPDAAERLEDLRVLGPVAETLGAGDRLTSFADEVADRFTIDGEELTGVAAELGSRAAVVVVVWILALMLLVGGRGLWEGTLSVLPSRRRDLVDDLARRAYGRAVRYAGFAAARAAVVAVGTFAVARLLGLEAPVLLSVWMMLWSLVPGLGLVVGAVLVALVALTDSTGAAVGVLAGAVGLQVLDATVVQPRVEAVSSRVGAFVTLAVGLAGFWIYGPGGTVVALALALLALSVADDLGRPLRPSPAPGPAPARQPQSGRADQGTRAGSA